MLFRRRIPPSFRERVRVGLWPRHSWPRSLRYFLKRVVRLNATPHAVAAGVAAGVFASFTPFLGFHMIIAVVAAWLLRGNLVAAAFGTLVGNPLTLPVFFLADYELGAWLLGHRAPAMNAEALVHGLLHNSFAVMWPIIEIMAIGAVPVGIAVAAAFYGLVWFIVRGYQAGRLRRLEQRKAENRAMTLAPIAEDEERETP